MRYIPHDLELALTKDFTTKRESLSAVLEAAYIAGRASVPASAKQDKVAHMKSLAADSAPKPTGSILEEAQQIIYGDREKTYGDPSKNLTLIAEYWSKHLSASAGDIISLTVDDVCVMMVLLKLARLANDPQHRDSKTDTAGYIALMQRCQDAATQSKPLASAGALVKCEYKDIRNCNYPQCNCSSSTRSK